MNNYMSDDSSDWSEFDQNAYENLDVRVPPPEEQGNTRKKKTEEWRVHSIKDKREIEGQIKYLVEWWPVYYKDKPYIWPDQWLALEDLEHCMDLVDEFNNGDKQAIPGIAACPGGHLQSKPYKRAKGVFGMIISSVIDEFTAMGQYSVARGLKHENKELNTEVGLHFLSRIFDQANDLEFTGVFAYWKIIGRNTSTKKKLETYRKGGFKIPFVAATTAIKPIRAKLNNDFETAVFLLISKSGLHWEKKDCHCGVGIINNDTIRKFYYFNPSVKENDKEPPGELIYLRDEMGSGQDILMGNGTQSNTADCIERALHFMGVVAENRNWKSESPNGWVPFNK